MRQALRALLIATSLTGLMAASVQANAGGVAAVPLNNGQETTDAKYGGSGSFTWWVDGSSICYTLTVRNLTATPVAAHIHGVAERQVAAGVVVPLIAPSGPTATSSNCAAVEAGLLSAIVADPGSYYVNVHTPMFPGGEVRGQLK